MKEVALAQRLRHYLKCLIFYTLGVGLSCVVGFFTTFYSEGLGALFYLLVPVVLFYGLHVSIGGTLIESGFRNRLLGMFPMIALSTALLALKIHVNESVPVGTHPLIPEGERVLSYFLYSLWTTVLLWEFYYILMSWLRTKNNRTLIKS